VIINILHYIYSRTFFNLELESMISLITRSQNILRLLSLLSNWKNNRGTRRLHSKGRICINQHNYNLLRDESSVYILCSVINQMVVLYPTLFSNLFFLLLLCGPESESCRNNLS